MSGTASRERDTQLRRLGCPGGLLAYNSRDYLREGGKEEWRDGSEGGGKGRRGDNQLYSYRERIATCLKFIKKALRTADSD